MLSQKPDYRIYTLGALFSILLSFVITHKVWVVNPDAVCYLQAAYSFNEKIPGIMSLCGQAKWPFYSIMIGSIARLTTFSYLHAAYFLNGFFSLLTVIFFIKIVAFISENLELKATDKKRLLWLALLTILFSHDFNATREYIIRDHGYWAFNLFSILCLLYYFRFEKLIYAWAFSVSLMIATLFRIEGAIFLALIPFAAFLNKRSPFWSRLYQFFALNTVSLVLLLIGIGWLVMHPINLHSYKRLEDLQFQVFHGFGFLLQRYYWQGNALISHVLGHGTPMIGAFILFVSLLTWYFVKIITNLSVIYSLLVVYAWIKLSLQKAEFARLVLFSYVAVNVLITLVFLGENMFLSKRYVLALTLTLMIWVPFVLNHLLAQWQARKWPVLLVFFCILLTALGGVFEFGYSKKYIYEAGLWLKNNVPENATLYSNDFQVMFYSDHFGNGIFKTSRAYIDPGLRKILVKQEWKKYDYMALRFTKKDIEKNYKLIQKITWKPVMAFGNKRGDQVLIYRTADL